MAGAGAGAETMAKVGAGAENKYFRLRNTAANNHQKLLIVTLLIIKIVYLNPNFCFPMNNTMFFNHLMFHLFL